MIGREGIGKIQEKRRIIQGNIIVNNWVISKNGNCFEENNIKI